mmetsp:Transcript_5694/g.14824  ORF Transcript_5694/g.14824 Transcript_5694/m.14824 type:complete len:218 (+) Transcript_5694:117-770(+)
MSVSCPCPSRLKMSNAMSSSCSRSDAVTPSVFICMCTQNSQMSTSPSELRSSSSTIWRTLSGVGHGCVIITTSESSSVEMEPEPSVSKTANVSRTFWSCMRTPTLFMNSGSSSGSASSVRGCASIGASPIPQSIINPVMSVERARPTGPRSFGAAASIPEARRFSTAAFIAWSTCTCARSAYTLTLRSTSSLTPAPGAGFALCRARAPTSFLSDFLR